MKSFKPKPNYIWSIVSVAGVLLLLAIFTFITLHSRDLITSFKEDFEMVIELNPTADDQVATKVMEALEKEPHILTSSIEFIPKEKGLEDLAQELGADAFTTDMPNPLFDVITFHVSAEAFDEEKLATLRDQLKNVHASILDVYFESSLIHQVTSNLDRLSLFFLVAGVLLIFFAVILIHNSIRLAIYANRFLIRNMELVGASWHFIRRPFLSRSFRHGLWSACLALGCLAGLAVLLWNRVPEIASYIKVEFVCIMTLVILISGLLINVVSTWFVVTRFLKMRLAELHG